MAELVKELGESFLKPLHRHFINLMCLDSGPLAKAKYHGPAIYNFSAFVVEVNTEWLAITAGHIFSELKMAINHGAIISNWMIDDSAVSQTPKQANHIALDIDRDVFFIHDDFPGMDYACIKLDFLTVQALCAEGIQPIPEDRWDKSDLHDFPYWLLVGTPGKFAELKLSQPLIKNHATVHVNRVSGPPIGHKDKLFKRLYAEVDFESMGQDSFDLDGMSGGPIFAIKPNFDTISDYRVVGVQSAKFGNNNIAICAALPFIKSLKQTLG